MSFETLENEILQILKTNHASRQDDMYLYACYVFDKTKDDGEILDFIKFNEMDVYNEMLNHVNDLKKRGEDI